MKILLDTHIFLWYISGDKRLSDDKRASIQDLNNEVYLSVVSMMMRLFINIQCRF